MAEIDPAQLAFLHELHENEIALRTLKNSTCLNCTNFMYPPEGQSYGWCLAIEDYAHELDKPYDMNCECFDAREEL